LNKSTLFIDQSSDIAQHCIERTHVKKVAREVHGERGVRVALNECDVEQCELVDGEIGTGERVLKYDAKETIDSHR
jgi:hypothetical protein